MARSGSTTRCCGHRATRRCCSAMAACAARCAPICRRVCARCSPTGRAARCRVSSGSSSKPAVSPIPARCCRPSRATARSARNFISSRWSRSSMPSTARRTSTGCPKRGTRSALADRIVLSKTDAADAAAIDRLTAHLREFSAAPIMAASHGAIDPGFLLDEAPDLAARLAAHHHDHAHAHSDGIDSFPLFFEAPLPWPVFEQVMAVLTALRGPDLLRVKGLVAVTGCRGPVVVHAVQHVAHRPIELEELAGRRPPLAARLYHPQPAARGGRAAVPRRPRRGDCGRPARLTWTRRRRSASSRTTAFPRTGGCVRAASHPAGGRSLP